MVYQSCFLTRDQTYVPFIGSTGNNHWTTREIPVVSQWLLVTVFFFFFSSSFIQNSRVLRRCLYVIILLFKLNPNGSEVKIPPANAGDLGSIPGSGRSPGEGNGNPLQYSWLENPKDRGTWWATVHRAAKSQIWLSTHTLGLINREIWRETKAWREPKQGHKLKVQFFFVNHSWSV